MTKTNSSIVCLALLAAAASTAFATTVDLSSLNDHLTAQNGDVLTGTLDGENQPYKISIAAGATVTLKDAIIKAGLNSPVYGWAGITCDGDCRIILEGENSVESFYGEYPGIYVPESATLTISGTGSLDASGSKGWGAGIGCGEELSCGNIVIEGGIITAEGGYCSAGIGGSYYANVGDITISGGIVMAVGDEGGSGIGGGESGTVGNINIGTDAKVTAIKGYGSPYNIGEGLAGSRTGSVTIGGVETFGILGSPFKYPVEETWTVSFDANGGSGEMSSRTTGFDPELILDENSFTREGYSFVGWNTEPNGSGDYYADQQYVNFAEVGQSITLFAQWIEGNVMDLATLTRDYVVPNGIELTGALGGNYKISIAAGATVTLNNVTVNGVNKEPYYWAGLNCLGDCHIILEGENVVKGFQWDWSGIYVPEGATLTISGTGSLDASSNGWGAGIGGGDLVNCGNIVIEGGTVKATGGVKAAGIGGGGDAYAGNITISGGTVIAVGGGYAAGIGGGAAGIVGNITISGSDTKVTAIKGDYAPYSIGEGDSYGEEFDDPRVGDIIIGDVQTPGIVSSLFAYPFGQWTVAFNANGGSGEMTSQTVDIEPELILNENSFTREGYSFVGWNTVADGRGVSYADQQKVNFAEIGHSITLYAQWSDGSITNIAALTGDYIAKDGEILTGLLDGATHPYKISIAAGATVTLNNVTINGVNDDAYDWAGITCEGECNIVLVGKNTVKGFYEDYPGIYVPEGATLTILGAGSLDASCNGFAAGIGGGYRIDCGNIVLEGGNIKATGGEYASGIGGGYFADVGDIVITDGVTKVTAIKDYEAYYSIGEGRSGTCGKITIGGREYSDGVEENPFVYPATTQYAAVQICEYNSGTRAVVDGAYEGTDAVEIPSKIDVKSVEFNRTFTKTAFSTLMLPFNVNTENVEGLDMALRFNGIGQDANGQKVVKMKIVWNASKAHTDLTANTPYMVLMNDEKFKVDGPVQIVPTADAVVENKGWEFRGTWQFKSWDKGDTELGYAYGFAASTDDKIVAGEFVKVGVGAWINPMRAYLVNAADLKKSQNKAQGVRGNVNGAGVSGASVLRTSSIREELPEVMNVVIEGDDEGGESEGSEKQTTVIGQFNTRTGEFKMNYDRGTFDLKGRRVNGDKANMARGAYYGKTVK